MNRFLNDLRIEMKIWFDYIFTLCVVFVICLIIFSIINEILPERPAADRASVIEQRPVK